MRRGATAPHFRGPCPRCGRECAIKQLHGQPPVTMAHLCPHGQPCRPDDPCERCERGDPPERHPKDRINRRRVYVRCLQLGLSIQDVADVFGVSRQAVSGATVEYDKQRQRQQATYHAGANPQRIHRCRVCDQPGHNARRCPQTGRG